MCPATRAERHTECAYYYPGRWASKTRPTLQGTDPPGAVRMTPAAAQDPWKDVSAARLAVAHLAVLAPVRDQPDVRVHTDGESAWVRWPAGKPEVVRCLLPVPGVEFFTRRDGLWFRFGSRLPTAETPPAGDG